MIGGFYVRSLHSIKGFGFLFVFGAESHCVTLAGFKVCL